MRPQGTVRRLICQTEDGFVEPFVGDFTNNVCSIEKGVSGGGPFATPLFEQSVNKVHSQPRAVLWSYLCATLHTTFAWLKRGCWVEDLSRRRAPPPLPPSSSPATFRAPIVFIQSPLRPPCVHSEPPFCSVRALVASSSSLRAALRSLRTQLWSLRALIMFNQSPRCVHPEPRLWSLRAPIVITEGPHCLHWWLSLS